jgi:hypothetical protein
MYHRSIFFYNTGSILCGDNVVIRCDAVIMMKMDTILADETPHPRTELGCRRRHIIIIDDVTRDAIVVFFGVEMRACRFLRVG